MKLINCILIVSSIFMLSFSDSTDWVLRLEALSPDNPTAYFNLAEEIADEAETDADRDLARHLFKLAGVLDADHLGRSACIALADLEGYADEKRRLLALARLLDRRIAEPNWLQHAESATTDTAAILALTKAFSYYRRGQGSRAITALQDGNADWLLAEYADAIGGEARFRENAKRYKNGEATPVKEQRDLNAMLRLEAALLAGDQNRTWSGDLLLNRGRILVEVDPERLPEALGVDPSRSIYRNGNWTYPK